MRRWNLAWPRVGRAPGDTGTDGVEAEGIPPDGSPGRVTTRTRRALMRNDFYPVAAARNRKPKRETASPHRNRTGNTRRKVRVVKVWSARALLKGRAIQAHTNETAVRDCTSLGKTHRLALRGFRRWPGLASRRSAGLPRMSPDRPGPRVTAGLLLPRMRLSHRSPGTLNTGQAAGGSSPGRSASHLAGPLKRLPGGARWTSQVHRRGLRQFLRFPRAVDLSVIAPSALSGEARAV